MLRRTIAERMSPIKKRLAIETPILEEIPISADVLASFEFPFPKVRGVIPVLVHGKAHGKVAGRWYRVLFPRPVTDPSVVCVGEARRGELPKPTIPEILIPALEKIKHIEIPRIDVRVPRWELDIPTADDFVNLIKKFFGDWGWLNWVRDAIAWAIGNWEYKLWDIFFRPRFIEKLNDKVLVPIRESLDSVKAGINDIITRINEGLDEAIDKVNAGLETLRSRTQDRVNETLATIFPRLYDAWGIPHTMALTPLHIRNVTSTGFEFQSYGETTCYWLALGSRR